MDKIIDLKERYQIMLFDPRLLFSYRKDCIAFLIAVRLYNSYKGPTSPEAGFINGKIQEIARYDRELAQEIRNILPAVRENKGIFAELTSAYRQGRDHFVSYISTHTEGLITKARAIEDKKTSQMLVELFASISNHEARYLSMYIADCDSWGGYVVSQGIRFFIERVNLMLKGGFDGKTQFAGLYKYFGDKEVTDAMLRSHEVRNLYRFNEQLNYLGHLIGLCRKSEESGEWEGFYGNDGFWDKRGKGKGKYFDEHAAAFRTKYGNLEFEERLMAKKEELGENPEAWGGVWEGGRLVKEGELQRLMRMLQHPSYQRQKVILPAASMLNAVMKERLKKLLAGRDESVSRLIDLLQKMEGLGVAKAKVDRKLRILLRRKKARLVRNMKNDINELMSKSSFLEYRNYIIEQDGILSKINPDFVMRYLERLYRISRAGMNYVHQQLLRGNFLRDIGSLTLTTGAENSAQTAWAQRGSLIRAENLTEHDFEEFQSLISRAAEILEKLRRSFGYLASRINEKFTIRVEDLQRLDLSTFGNVKFEISRVEEYFNRLV
tara:strand:- start:3245 stop:4894 length:1650 start_codon:yes stop_codon:yes gene_type:complete